MPEGMGRDQFAALLAREVGLDEQTMRMRLVRQPPVMLGTLAPDIAGCAVRAIERAGGEAIAPSLTDIEALGESINVRQLEQRHDGFLVHPRRAESRVLRFEEIDVVIRGAVRRADTSRADRTVGGMFDMLVQLGSVRTGAHGSPAMAAAFAGDESFGFKIEGGEQPSRPQRRLSHKLDLHHRDGRVYQVDGDRFGFCVLGAERAYSDQQNMDRLCAVISERAPHAVFDPYFSLWSAPPETGRLRLKGMALHREDPAFAFYSRWMALVYRRLLHPGSALNPPRP